MKFYFFVTLFLLILCSLGCAANLAHGNYGMSIFYLILAAINFSACRGFKRLIKSGYDK